MFLLILTASILRCVVQQQFLHSNMFLLIHFLTYVYLLFKNILHSNMFLLIHFSAYGSKILSTSFTFQYVSINTEKVFRSLFLIIFLHSNMFLLIRFHGLCIKCGHYFTFQYVSINTIMAGASMIAYIIFTFQYVSINT